MAWYLLPEFDATQKVEMSNNKNLSHCKEKP